MNYFLAKNWKALMAWVFIKKIEKIKAEVFLSELIFKIREY